MLTSNEIKNLKMLRDKKFRAESGLFIAEGEKMIAELISSDFEIEKIYAVKEWVDNVQEKKNKSLFNAIIPVSEKELERISQLKQPNKVLAVAKIPSKQFNLKNITDDLILVLDNINDPGNLGTIIRTAHWFGIKNIICSENTVDVFNFKTVQATMGSLFRINIFYKNLVEFFEENLKQDKIPVYVATLDGENMYHRKLLQPAFLIIGSESHGIGEELMKFATQKISIPFFNQESKSESLNAALAAGIIIAEWRRQNIA